MDQARLCRLLTLALLSCGAAASADSSTGASAKKDRPLPVLPPGFEMVLRQGTTAPPLITAVKVPFEWAKPNEFKTVLDREKGNIDSIRDEKGRTALHWAVKERDGDYALLLIRRGADVNAVDEKGYTPLHYAVEAKASLLQKELVLAGADLNKLSKDKKTALTLAIELNRADDVEALLWMGAKRRLPDLSDDEQPLSLAYRQGNQEVIEAIEIYENAEKEGKAQVVPRFVKNALHDAARKADYEQLQAFLTSGVNINMPDENGRTPLIQAVSAAQEEVVFYLLMLGANPNIADKKGRTPLNSSMGWLGASFSSMRRLLILKGASPFAVRADGFNELTWAAERDNLHGVQWLLWLGANGREPTKRGTPFQIAFQAGRQEILDLLRRNGIDEPIVLSKDPVWNLHNAVRRGDHELLLAMLAQGVPVDAPDKDGNSPLVMAIATRNLKTADLLIEHGAERDFKNEKNGVSPIFMTMIWDYPRMTEFRKELFEAGIDLNVQNAKGETPLMRGVWKYPTTPLKQLVEEGVDLNIRDNNGKTALRRAIDAGHHKTADYLRENGATE